MDTSLLPAGAANAAKANAAAVQPHCYDWSSPLTKQSPPNDSLPHFHSSLTINSTALPRGCLEHPCGRCMDPEAAGFCFGSNAVAECGDTYIGLLALGLEGNFPSFFNLVQPTAMTENRCLG